MIVDSPRSTPVICGNVVRTTGVPSCLLRFPMKAKAPTHIRFPPKMGAIAHLYRGEVYRSTIWRTRLRQHDQLGDRHDGPSRLSTTFSRSAGFTPATRAGRAAHCRVSGHGGAAVYRYFNVWARPSALAGEEFSTRQCSPVKRATIAGRQFLRATTTTPRHHNFIFSAPRGGGCVATTFGFSLSQAIAYYGKIAIHPTPAG